MQTNICTMQNIYYFSLPDCGNFKIKKPDSDSDDSNAETSTRCTTVTISDRFILTAAQCVP